jgi:uncharacterized membrane protein YedE/YeeE
MKARGLAAFVAGLVFAIGIAISGMSHPRKVLGFLDVTGDWDPSLAFVMAGALAVGTLAFRVILRRPAPILGDRFALPERAAIDRPLLVGAAVFGIGWGIGGFCPGPALVTVVTGASPVLVFVAAMLGGMALFDALAARREKSRG